MVAIVWFLIMFSPNIPVPLQTKKPETGYFLPNPRVFLANILGLNAKPRTIKENYSLKIYKIALERLP